MDSVAQATIFKHGLDKQTDTLLVKTGDKYYDSGGPGGARFPNQPGNYINCSDPFNEEVNCASRYTFCAPGGDTVGVNFLDLFIVSGDHLKIFSGTKAIGTPIYNSIIHGVSLNGMRLTTGTLHKSKSPDGCLTFEFFCSTIGNTLGWEADFILFNKATKDSASCKPVCKDLFNVQMPADTCYIEKSVSDLLTEKKPTCAYVPRIFYPQTTDQLSNIQFNETHVGKTILFEIVETASNTSCVGYVRILPPNKVSPTCTSDTMSCLEYDDRFSGKTNFISCGGRGYKVRTLNFHPLDCSSDFVGLVSRTIEYTDTSGLLVTCMDSIFITKASIQSFIAPGSLIFSCSDFTSTAKPDSLTPSYLLSRFDLNHDFIRDGTQADYILPLVDGDTISSQSTFCTRTLTFSDLIINGCGNAFKIRRQWVFKSECADFDSIYIQNISITDVGGPSINNVKGIFKEVTGDKCYTDLILDSLDQFDDCSYVSQKIELTYPDPINLGKTIVINSVLPVQVNLSPGVYALNYLFSDACFNVTKKEVCISIADRRPLLLDLSSSYTFYSTPGLCESMLTGKHIMPSKADASCTTSDILLMAHQDTIDLYKKSWSDKLTSSCPELEAAEKNRLINAWMEAFVYKPTLNIEPCTNNKIVIRKYKSSLLPARPSGFTCDSIAWFFYNGSPLFRSWYNKTKPTDCHFIPDIDCDLFDSIQSVNQYQDAIFHSDSLQCAKDFIHQELEQYVDHFIEKTALVVFEDTSSLVVDTLPSLHLSLDSMAVRSLRSCCPDGDCKGQSFLQNAWPGTFTALKNGFVRYYGGPLHASANYDPDNYYTYPECDYYASGSRPIYCTAAINSEQATLDTNILSTYFATPVWNRPVHAANEFNISSACPDRVFLMFRDSLIQKDCIADTLIRIWKASSDCIGEKLFYQRLIINKSSSFEVEFPRDITVDCEAKKLSDSASWIQLLGRPRISSSQDQCLEVYFTDSLIFQGTGDVCLISLRKWTIRNKSIHNLSAFTKEFIINDSMVADVQDRYCVYRSLKDGGDGLMVYYQRIKYIDRRPPIVGLRDTIILGTNCQSPIVRLPFKVEDDCSPYETVDRQVQLDVNNDGSFEKNITPDSILQIDAGLGVGIHRLKFTVGDLCGNVDTGSVFITVLDDGIPKPFCMSPAVNVDIPATGLLRLHARDFDAGSLAGCGSGVLKFSFSTNLMDTTKNITCDSIGARIMTIYLTNEAGKFTSCSVPIEFSAAPGACANNTPVFTTGGLIKTNQNVGIKDVRLITSFGGSDTTNNLGKYAIPGIARGTSFTLKAEKSDVPTNGLSSIDLLLIERHIKGITTITNPYILLAADVNKSGGVTVTDLIELRKMILGSITSFSNNKDWIFIPAGFSFKDPNSPWLFDTTLFIPSIAIDIPDADFIGIKIGDVNNSAVVAAQQPESRQSMKFYFKSQPLKDYTVWSVFASQPIRDVSAVQIKIGSEGMAIIENQNSIFGNNHDLFSINNKELNFVWTSVNPVQIPIDRPLFSFMTNGDFPSFVDEKNFQNHMLINDLVYPISGENTPNGQLAINIFPNPANETNTIEVYHSSALPFQWIIMNSLGQIIPCPKPVLQTGVNRISLKKSDLGGSGLYYFIYKSGNIYKKYTFIML